MIMTHILVMHNPCSFTIGVHQDFKIQIYTLTLKESTFRVYSKRPKYSKLMHNKL